MDSFSMGNLVLTKQETNRLQAAVDFDYTYLKSIRDNPFSEDKEINKCPECGKEGEIIWGWDNVYYDFKCPDGHVWTYNFPKE
jgi:hypothetical protein